MIILAGVATGFLYKNATTGNTTIAVLLLVSMELLYQVVVIMYSVSR